MDWAVTPPAATRWKNFKIKEREWNKLLLVVAPNQKWLKKYLVWNETLQKLAKKYWPSPLTVVGDYRHRNWSGKREIWLLAWCRNKNNSSAYNRRPLFKGRFPKTGPAAGGHLGQPGRRWRKFTARKKLKPYFPTGPTPRIFWWMGRIKKKQAHHRSKASWVMI